MAEKCDEKRRARSVEQKSESLSAGTVWETVHVMFFALESPNLGSGEHENAPRNGFRRVRGRKKAAGNCRVVLMEPYGGVPVTALARLRAILGP